MKIFNFGTKVLPCIAVAGALALTGCQDDNYDFDEVDMTVGIGSDGLTLPVSSTNVIKLEDVLELDGSECVKIMDNGDYMFTQEGGEVSPSHVRIDAITIDQSEPVSGEITISAVPAIGGTETYDVTASGRAQSFEYQGDKPDEVEELVSVGTDFSFTFTIHFPNGLSNAVSSIDELTVTLPGYMVLGGEFASATDNTLHLTNISTSRDYAVTVPVTGLDFSDGKQTNGSVSINGSRIDMTGEVYVDVKAKANTAAGVDGSVITSTLTMTPIEITSANGRFNPEIDLDNLGDIEVTGVPDFLTDGEVRVDLYNPSVLLTINNTMEISGKVYSGVITSYKDGEEIASVNIPEFTVNPNGDTKIRLCRRPNIDTPAGYTDIEVADLSKVIEKIPDNISFTAKAKADNEKYGNFQFDHEYTVQPDYSVNAPIAFDKDAKIVYKDTLDGWHDDLEDFELADGAYVNLTATIENRVPAYLTVQAKAIDVDGNEMADDEISVSVTPTIAASGKDGNAVETPLTVDLRQVGEGAFKRLDGLTFKIEAAASDNGQNPVTGTTLNAKKHSLVAKDIKVTLKGKIIGDFN